MVGSVVVTVDVVVVDWTTPCAESTGLAVTSSATLSAASEIAGLCESTPRRRTLLDIGGISFRGMNI
jgi:hypothetical protein